MQDPILIVGAGPTGLTLAIELARRGVPFRLIDRRLEPQNSDRAAFVKSRSLEIFAAFGLVETMLRDGEIINGFDIFSGGRRKASFRLHDVDSPFPFFLGISETKTEQCLTEKLASLGGRIERGVGFVSLEQETESLNVRLRSGVGDEERRFSWLVAADGTHSGVREALGIDFAGHDYKFHWGVVDGVISNWQQPDDIVASQFDPVIYAAPIGRGRRRIYFRADPQTGSDLAEVERQLALIAPGLRLTQADTPQLFQAHCRIAARFRAGRVLLAGDAAHAISPTQAHGMNTGIQDAFNLGWKLASVANGLAPNTLLDSYEAERRPVAQSFGTSGDAMEALIDKGDPAATNALMEALATDDGRRQVALGEAEIAYRYDSAIIKEHGQSPDAPDVTPVGSRLGDAGPLIMDGCAMQLHQILAHGGHTLFLFLEHADGAVREDTCTIAGEVTERYGETVKAFAVSGGGRSTAAEKVQHLLDKTGTLHTRLCGEEIPTLCMVRPDFHLGYRSTLPLEEALERYLSGVFLPAHSVQSGSA